MAWTTPRTWSTGEIVTEAQFNEQIRDNEDYLKTEADKIDDISSNSVLGSRAFNTIYQNTTTSIIFTVITLHNNTTSGVSSLVRCSSTTPPSTGICLVGLSILPSTTTEYRTQNFIVPPNYYYTVSSDNGTLWNWLEWNIH